MSKTQSIDIIKNYVQTRYNISDKLLISYSSIIINIVVVVSLLLIAVYARIYVLLRVICIYARTSLIDIFFLASYIMRNV